MSQKQGESAFLSGENFVRDYPMCSISSEGFLPPVVDIKVIWTLGLDNCSSPSV